jgi:hypothetical protein
MIVIITVIPLMKQAAWLKHKSFYKGRKLFLPFFFAVIFDEL